MTQSSRPGLSVIVPCRNEYKAITRFMANLLGQEQVPGGMEFLIVDGQSDDGTRQILDELARQDSRIVIIDNPRRTVSPGLNLAIRRARGPVVARMDVHTEYAFDYLRCCVRELEATGAQNVGGPALPRGVGYFQRANAAAFGSPFAVGGAKFHDPDYEGHVDTVPYGCWHRHTLEGLGYFDEELVRNQDDELNLRLIRRGGRVWQTPRIRSWYQPRSGVVSLFRQYLQYGYWKVRVISKHRVPASWRHLVPPVAVLAGLGLLLVVPFHAGAWMILLTCLVTWLFLALVASVAACRRASQWDILPLLPLVLATYHVAYGLGFLRGVFDLALGRRPDHPSLSDLTR